MIQLELDRVSVQNTVGYLNFRKKEVRDRVTKLIHIATTDMRSDSIDFINKKKIVDTGTLKSSKSFKVVTKPLLGELRNITNYAAHVEYGTRPHFPPSNKLEGWVKRKGMAKKPKQIKSIAFLIARKIAKRGTKPRTFINPSFTINKQRFFISLRKLQTELNRP